MDYTETCMGVHEASQEKSFQYPPSTLETSCKELRYVSHHSYAYEHREEFIQATPSDPNPYSRGEMDERFNDIYIVQYDSMNDFMCKLDSVYHPLNDKITWLTKTIEHLGDNVTTIVRQKTHGVSARKP
ncbi:hypothetical protein Bca52824_023508 [Brassica carinata]|uniref:Uncharacterized protein n=1 Tax=Brassica carinata TaxID=52824 RepID=A0A8X7VIK8_BRACI|nr:hypothetical protein Bca52824_023508 [Brassica carinata]